MQSAGTHGLPGYGLQDLEGDLGYLPERPEPIPRPPEDDLDDFIIAAAHLRALEDIASLSRGMLNQNTTLQAELAAIRAQLNDRQDSLPTPSSTPAPDANRPRQTMKAKAPATFSGEKRDELETFLSQCRLCFLVNPSSFVNESHKALYAGSYLEGIAYSWFEPILRDYERHQENKGEIPCPPQLASFASFSAALIAMYGDPDLRNSKLRELENLKQVTSVAAYSSEFQRLKPYLDYNDSAFKDKFYKGLRSNVKDDLAKFEIPVKTLEELMLRAQQVDNRIAERIAERRFESHPPTTSAPPARKPPAALPSQRAGPSALTSAPP